MTGSPFQTIPPARVRFETQMNSVDEIVPCAIVCFPDPKSTDGSIMIHTQFQNPAQMIAMMTVIMRQMIAFGISQEVLTQLVSAPLRGNVEQHDRRDVPPDDLPAHLRPGWKPPPKPPGS